MEQCHGRFISGWMAGKRFLTEGVAGHGDRFPRTVGTAPRLAELRQSLDNAVRHRVPFWACSVQGQELDLSSPCGFLPTQDVL